MPTRAHAVQQSHGHGQSRPPREFESGEYLRVVRVGPEEAKRRLAEMSGEGVGSGVLHAVEDAPIAASALPRAETISRTRPRVSPTRIVARTGSDLDLRQAIGAAGSTVSAVARHVELDEKVIRSWCDPASEAHPAAGDIRALPPRVHLAYAQIDLALAQARVQGNAPAKSQDAIVRDLLTGALSIALAQSTGDDAAVKRAALAIMADVLGIVGAGRSDK